MSSWGLSSLRLRAITSKTRPLPVMDTMPGEHRIRPLEFELFCTKKAWINALLHCNYFRRVLVSKCMCMCVCEGGSTYLFIISYVVFSCRYLSCKFCWMRCGLFMIMFFIISFNIRHFCPKIRHFIWTKCLTKYTTEVSLKKLHKWGTGWSCPNLFVHRPVLCKKTLFNSVLRESIATRYLLNLTII